jgi:fumarate hydratase subunit beta
MRIDCRPHLRPDQAAALRAGDPVEIFGELVTIRDAAARRLFDVAASGQALPVQLAGRLLYAVGPSPAKPGQVVGSAGPTTIERFTKYLPVLFAAGVRGVIGKGELHGAIVEMFRDAGALYFAAIGGLGALLGKRIVASEVLAFADLGPEAIFRFEVDRFPAVTIIDSTGANYHDTARNRWRRTSAPAGPLEKHNILLNKPDRE